MRQLLSLACLAALASATAGQDLRPSFPLPTVHTGVSGGPGAQTLHVVYDVQADRIREIHTVPADALGLGNSFCFDNSELAQGDPTNNHWVTPNVGEELVDWGLKNCRESGLVRSICIGYGSNASSGGRIQIALYQGTQGFGSLGTEVFRRTITGLPPNGGHLPIFLTLDFGSEPLHLGDGPIGWGFFQLDGLTGPSLVRAPRGLLGTADALDLYAGQASQGSYVGTFNYGGCAAPFYSLCASMWMQIEEVPANQVAHATVLNGSGINPLRLSEVLPARLGDLWVANLDTRDMLGFRQQGILFASGGSTTPLPSPFGEILIDPNLRIGAPQLSPYGAFFAAIPADPSLAGTAVFVQGAVLDRNGAYLSNALRIRVGY